jgi:hypothetical protein
MTRRISLFLIAVLSAVTLASASNLANPAAPVPGSRVALGVSYHLGGYPVTRLELPSMVNRIELRLSYAPIAYFNIGIDGGAAMMEVAGDTSATDTISPFLGKMGFAGGAHIKLSTPFILKDVLGAVLIARGGYFSSKNDQGASYGGIDANVALGLQFHIKGFGYFTAGSQMYLIQGTNRSYDGVEGTYSNAQNIRGWIAIDFFPKLDATGNAHPYVSVEATASPGIGFGGRAPIENFGLSVCIGTITKRLYGEQTGIEWQP